ncbi:MAG TPA: hypothetical protein VN738_11355 [Acidothermaceae bacterium]|nr:hypothetical protein [Acidothermaceae bacterium]
MAEDTEDTALAAELAASDTGDVTAAGSAQGSEPAASASADLIEDEDAEAIRLQANPNIEQQFAHPDVGLHGNADY